MKVTKIDIKQHGSNLIDEISGEVVASTVPKFDSYTTKKHYEMDEELEFIDCQCAKELEDSKLEKYMEERCTVAEQKFDGHRGKLHITSQGNRLFSRNVVKIGWHSENSDQVPHIRDLKIDEFFHDTVIDGEILLPVEDCDCRDVQGVTGALPARAVEKQLEVGFAFLNAFDIIKYNGLDVSAMPYWKRKILLYHVVKEFNSPFVKFCDIYATEKNYNELQRLFNSLDKELYTGKLFTNIALEMNQFIHKLEGSYDDLFSEFLQQGLEGLIIKDISCRYEQKKCDNFVKMKAHLTFDCVIMGYDDPVMMYEGKTLDEGGKWSYWADYEDECTIVTKSMTRVEGQEEGLFPVTKFYAEDWIGAIRFGVWKEVHLQYFIDTYGDSWEQALDQLTDEGQVMENGKHHTMLVEVGKSSGMDEATRKLISENKEEYLGKVIEVEAQRIIDKNTGSLQHPRFYRMREDKSSEQCTFDDHIRK